MAEYTVQRQALAGSDGLLAHYGVESVAICTFVTTPWSLGSMLDEAGASSGVGFRTTFS